MDKEQIEQLNQSALALVDPRKAAHKAEVVFLKELQDRRLDEFEARGGCKKCGGRGWIVNWDTLDSMSGCYAEYGDCPNEACTPTNRAHSGLDVSYYSKYDRNRGVPRFDLQNSAKTDQERDALANLARVKDNAQGAWASCAQAYECAKEITKGKLVEVVRKPRGHNSAPKGSIGVVFWTGQNSVGTDKVGLRLKDGSNVFSTLKSCVVIETLPGSEWDDRSAKKTMPVIGVVKHVSSKAVLIRPVNTDKEFWVPFSQCSELQTCKKKESVSFELPLWMAKKVGLG